ncbi:methylglyoxal synthase [Glaciimonas sp. Gout2]|uniref:methylglyoxal synthase n=1 Tax=unclassified Glaciimonas TaxID=2644401 RepID=UPI002B23A5C3|nr:MULTISPECIES: methylglyoxal synthase [unclassified Glaciimonas]MEB0011905.1 methylglyoxal synthase [Glaciimonas sp. Cout2]MEB0082860.1 methylglyoxal synthase [Glaciimonas sp. Gout2]
MPVISASDRRPYRIGLASSRTHQDAPHSPLAQLINGSRAAIEQHLQPNLIVVGRTLDAINQLGLLDGYPHVERFPYGRQGGLMKLVSRVVDSDPTRTLDAVIYLMDPVDPSSTFPEAVALKRQCVIHGKPFLSTLAGAREWLELESVALGAVPNPELDLSFDLANEGIALIAHDAMKERMLAIAERHFSLLDQFAFRCATGTTGSLLNKLAQKIKGEEAGRHWVKPFLSGPMGGDAQIAELILDRQQCRRVLFLEDPHVARQHEADIQLLERAARTVTDYALCINDAGCGERWLTLLEKRVSLKSN